MEPVQKMYFPGSWRVQSPDWHPGLAVFTLCSQGSGGQTLLPGGRPNDSIALSISLTPLESPGDRDTVYCFLAYSAQLSPRLGS